MSYNVPLLRSYVLEKISRRSYSLHISKGNRKTGSIPAFSLPPLFSCSGTACKTCGENGCYALKNMCCHGYTDKNNVLKAWTENLVYSILDIEGLEKELNDYFDSISAPRYFRVHVGGDFVSRNYARMWFRIAKNHPHTRFLAFTKQFDFIREIPFFDLENFSLVLSGWTGVNIPDDLRTYYRCAWCDDGIETRIPSDSLECPGNCETCGMCWNLKQIGKDTYFNKH